MAIKNLDEVGAKIGLKAGEFKALYEDKEEKEIKLDEFEIIPKSDYNTRITNIEREKIDQGKKAGEEETRKQFRDTFGLKEDGVKKNAPLSEYKAAIEKKILATAALPENEKIKEIERDRDAFKDKAADWEGKYNGLQGTYAKKEKQTKISDHISSKLPKDFVIPANEAIELTIRRAQDNGITADIDDTGIVIFKKGSEIMKDANRVPLPADVVLKEYYTPYAKPVSGGGGGGDNPGDKGTGKVGFEAFKQMMLTSHPDIRPGTPEYAMKMRTDMKEKKWTV